MRYPSSSAPLTRELRSMATGKRAKKLTPASWPAEQEFALVEYLVQNDFTSSWPATKKTRFWEAASEYIHRSCGIQRTSGSCRARVVMRLKEKFHSPWEAFQHLKEAARPVQTTSRGSCSPISIERIVNPSQSMSVTSRISSASGSSLEIVRSDPFKDQFTQLTEDDQLVLLSDLMVLVASKFGVVLPSDFTVLSLHGMENLHNAGKPNLIYALSKGFGQTRPDDSDCLFPLKRMPYGLLEYMVQFFVSKHGNNLQCPDDYRTWLQSMYTLFGTKWSKLFCGPLWSVEPTEQNTPSNTDNAFDPLNAHVNVPAPTERTLRRDISASEFSTNSEIQIKSLNEACRLLPGAKWWIKADGCDVISSLEESMRSEWQGDVDLGDGAWQELHQAYLNRIKEVENIEFSQDVTSTTISDLLKQQQQLKSDLNFIHNGLQDAKKEYEVKVSVHTASDKTLFNLGWKVDELSRLYENGRKILVTIDHVLDLLKDESNDEHLPNLICSIKNKLPVLLRGIYLHKRKPATHVLAILISHELRNVKPYALPVQLISYSSLNEKEMRSIINKVIEALVSTGMSVSGFVANGEYNVLRAKGYTRPLSVLRIKADVRAKYYKMGMRKMLDMLTPMKIEDKIVGKISNPAISDELLTEIWSWKMQGISEDDIVDRLRGRTVPSGYPLHSWKKGEEETKIDKLKSILAQLDYSYRIKSWAKSGVPFDLYMYVPEVHPISGKEYHEIEDEGHLFKRIGTSTRQGGPQKLQLDRFYEALYDESSKLTFPALTGQRKQSIRDVETLFSADMEHFMKSKGYTYEAKYIRTIRNWRRAQDERGLSQLQRAKYNYQMLGLILEELMPWYEENYDFSTLEVNRPVKGVLGFSHQTVIAMTTNIESREWKRRNYAFSIPENPRSSSTDDVECFFSILRDMVGQHFTVRQVRYNWRKVCCELFKRLDPDLPFYYHTSSHDRFYEGERPSFDAPKESRRNPRKQRVRRREQLSQLVYGRATLPKPGARSIRMEYHNIPTELPPPPNVSRSATMEHSYAKN